jgi:hypothetical protein
MAGVNALVRALNTDIDRLREHTCYLTLAQAEKATADKIDASRRLVQRTFVGLVVALALAIIAAGLALYANSEKQRAEGNATEAKQQSELARQETERADKFITLVSSNSAGLRAMKKICSEASSIVEVLATTRDKAEYLSNQERFWELYFGPMYIVAIHQAKKSGQGFSDIESAMVMMGNQLRRIVGADEALPHEALLPLADAVKNQCREYSKRLKVIEDSASPASKNASDRG